MFTYIHLWIRWQSYRWHMGWHLWVWLSPSSVLHAHALPITTDITPWRNAQCIFSIISKKVLNMSIIINHLTEIWKYFLTRFSLWRHNLVKTFLIKDNVDIVWKQLPNFFIKQNLFYENNVDNCYTFAEQFYNGQLLFY